MANYRKRSEYDLALNTNTHTRIQTALQTGNLITAVMHLSQTKKARTEAQQHHQGTMRGLSALAQVVEDSADRTIAAADRNADLAAKQRYSQWVGSTDEGARLHNWYIPLATKQIAAIDIALDKWREGVLFQVAEAVSRLSPEDQGLVNRTSTPFVAQLDPLPEQPAQAQMKSIRVFRALLIVVATSLICGVIGALIALSNLSSTSLADEGYSAAPQQLEQVAQDYPQAVDEVRDGIGRVLNDPILSLWSDNEPVAGVPWPQFADSVQLTTPNLRPSAYSQGQTVLMGTALGEIVGKAVIWPVAGTLGGGPLALLVLAGLRGRRRRHLVKTNQEQLQQWQDACRFIHDKNSKAVDQAHIDTDRARREAIAGLEAELGFAVEGSDAMGNLFASQAQLVAHQERMRQFISTAYQVNPLPSSWVPLLAAPVVSPRWDGTAMEATARNIRQAITELDIWVDKPAPPQSSVE